MRVVVASVHMFAVSTTRALFQPTPVFSMPAVKPGDPPALLVIEDQHIREKIYGSDMGGHPPQYLDRHVRVQDVARDVVNEWATIASFATTEAHPGIWVCVIERGDGQEPEYLSGPTPDQVKIYTARERAWRRELVLKGDEYFNAKMPKQITQRIKEAARAEGLDREWLDALTPDSNTVCPFCRKTVLTGTIVCPTCTNVIDRAGYDRLQGVSVAPAHQSATSGPMIPIPAPKPQTVRT